MNTGFGSDDQLEIGHVLFMDIVGFSKLLVDEQSDVSRRLNQIVRNSDQFRSAEAADKLIRLPTGDGMVLVFFTSPEAPVRCAVEIAKALKDSSDFGLRMGIHSGPVNKISDVNDRANLAGSGINIAQRVMDCGDAGHILLSKHVAEDLEQHSKWRPHLQDFGECEVKHGVRVSVVNLYRDDVGNRALPKKFRQAKGVRVRKLGIIAAVVLLVALLAAGGFYYRSEQSRRLTDKDTILLANFANSTGDPVFDGTLRQGLASQLEQSPFLSLISDDRIAHTLALMSQPKDARLTPELAREVGERTGSAATIEGSIAKLGSEYVVGLKAVNCGTGDLLAQEQVTANGKEQVLNALGQAASSLRQKLGESSASIPPASSPRVIRMRFAPRCSGSTANGRMSRP